MSERLKKRNADDDTLLVSRMYGGVSRYRTGFEGFYGAATAGISARSNTSVLIRVYTHTRPYTIICGLLTFFFPAGDYGNRSQPVRIERHHTLLLFPTTVIYTFIDLIVFQSDGFSPPPTALIDSAPNPFSHLTRFIVATNARHGISRRMHTCRYRVPSRRTDIAREKNKYIYISLSTVKRLESIVF